MRRIVVFVVVTLLSASATPPQQRHFTTFWSGNKLLEDCQPITRADRQELSEHQVAYGVPCYGYVLGVADATNSFGYQHQIPQMYCVPEHVTPDQLVRVVVKWLENNPERLHMAGALVVNAALTTAFPCN